MTEKYKDCEPINKDDGKNKSVSTALAGTSSEIFKISPKIPVFWPEEPEIWFAQVEGQFANSGVVSDTTKFNYVISQLDQQFSREVKDIIINPPTSNKYQKLKEELIKRLSASRENQVKQLLMHEELGDRKPSQFLRHLQSLAGVAVPEEFLKTIWTSRLPHSTQTVLAAQPTGSLDVLADLADRIRDIAVPTHQVASTSFGGPGSSLDAIAKEIAELRHQMQALSTKVDRKSRSSSSNHNRNRSRSRSRGSYERFPICWYHKRFGKNSTKCTKPCDYKSENLAGGR